MPDLGIGEAIAGLGSLFGGAGDALGLGGLFGADAAAGAGAAAAGAGEAAGAGASIGDIVGTGAGLFGGTTGLEGTALAGGFTGGLDALTATTGLGALGTAADFLAAPGASEFNAAALTPGIGSPGGGAGALGAASPPPQPITGPGVTGSSVFDTGTSGITGVGSTGAPSAAVPAGASASSVAAPSGVSGLVDPTAAGGVATGAAPAGQAAGSTSISDLLSKAGGGALKSLTSNPLGIALGAGGLGYNILQGQKQSQNQQALQADAKSATANSSQMVASGEALQQYLTNGTLPPAYQQQVDQAIADAKTKAISNAAQQGLPTDPNQNTALATELAKIDSQRGAMQTQIASQLFQSGQGLVGSGQQAAGLSGDLYKTLVQNDTTSAANTGKAIATLAAALNGKSSNSAGGITISTG
jgi:hypothetical protein